MSLSNSTGANINNVTHDLKIGDRVRLTTKMIATLTRSRSRWIKRVGTIRRIAKVADQVTIKWDDRESCDQWPTKALERIK
jgi:hypothetical protein